MRENIGIFRGKDTIEHKWRYGNLTVHGDTAQIWEDTEQGLLNYLVDPETVGEFTGMTDKSGEGIFEGDIVNVENSLVKGIFAVEYGITGAFIVVNPKNNRFFLGGCNSTVLGNIHDNPDLI